MPVIGTSPDSVFFSGQNSDFIFKIEKFEIFQIFSDSFNFLFSIVWILKKIQTVDEVRTWTGDGDLWS